MQRVVDPENAGRFLALRRAMTLVFDGAVEPLDELTRQYTPHPHSYGYVFPAEQAARETRVIGRLVACRITLDAIHA